MTETDKKPLSRRSFLKLAGVAAGSVFLTACSQGPAETPLTLQPSTTSSPSKIPPATDTPAPTSTETPRPTHTETNTPNPTATLASTIETKQETNVTVKGIKPIINPIGMRIRFDSWAPDSLWIAYWVGENEDKPASLAFANTDSSETCNHNEVQTKDLWSGQVIWNDDDIAIVIPGRESEALRGAPCEAFTPYTGVTLPDPYVKIDLSPDGRYSAETEIINIKEQAFYSELRITEIDTGRIIFTIPYVDSPHLVFAGPRWLNDNVYLLGKTVDQGILYYSLSGNRLGHVFPDILGLKVNNEQNVTFIGTQVDLAGGKYHLLFAMGPQGSLLYHSELNKIEELNLYYPGSLADSSGGWKSFSPDGKWLLLTHDSSIGEGEVDYWLRPVDPFGSTLFQFANHVASGGLSSNGQLMAFYNQGDIQITHFPGGQLQCQWDAPGYGLDLIWWSPDGSRLVARGLHNETGQEALFVIEP